RDGHHRRRPGGLHLEVAHLPLAGRAIQVETARIEAEGGRHRCPAEHDAGETDALESLSARRPVRHPKPTIAGERRPVKTEPAAIPRRTLNESWPSATLRRLCGVGLPRDRRKP